MRGETNPLVLSCLGLTLGPGEKEAERICSAERFVERLTLVLRCISLERDTSVDREPLEDADV